MKLTSWLRIVVLGLALVMPCGVASAQVGKSLGVKDVNTASEADLRAMPHMTPAIVKGIVDTRPFTSIVDLNTYLLGQKLSQQRARDFYGRVFGHINPNPATPEEIIL